MTEIPPPEPRPTKKKLYKDQVDLYPVLTSPAFIDFVKNGQNWTPQDLLTLTVGILQESPAMKQHYFEQFKALKWGLDPVFALSLMELHGEFPPDYVARALDPYLTNEEKAKYIAMKDRFEQELKNENYMVPEIQAGAVDFFKKLTYNLQAGRKYANFVSTREETNEMYVRRVWRDLNAGFQWTKPYLLTNKDLVSSNYLKNFFWKVWFNYDGMQEVFQVMMQQCPYYEIFPLQKDEVEPTNIFELYNRWKGHVEDMAMSPGFNTISDLWLRQIGTWKMYELKFYKWFQEYSKWELSSSTALQVLRRKARNNGPPRGHPRFNEWYDEYFNHFKLTENKVDPVIQGINHGILQCHDFLLATKFKMSMFYSFTLGDLAEPFQKFYTVEQLEAITNQCDLAPDYRKWREKIAMERNLPFVFENNGDEYHLQREFAFEQYVNYLSSKQSIAANALLQHVNWYESRISSSDWFPTESHRNKRIQDLKKFKEEDFPNVFQPITGNVHKEVRVFLVSQKLTSLPLMSSDLVLDKYQHYLLPGDSTWLDFTGADYSRAIQQFQEVTQTSIEGAHSMEWLEKYLDRSSKLMFTVFKPFFPDFDFATMLSQPDAIVQRFQEIQFQFQQVNDLQRQIAMLNQKALVFQQEKTKEIQQYQQAIDLLSGDRDREKEAKEKIQQEKQELMKQHQESIDRSQTLEKEVTEAHQKLRTTFAELQNKNQSLENIQATKAKLEQELLDLSDTATTHRIELNETIQSLQSSAKEKEQVKQELEEQLQILRQEMENRQAEANTYYQLYQQQKEEVTSASRRFQELNKRIEEQQRQVEELGKQSPMYAKQAKSYKETINELKAQVNRLNKKSKERGKVIDQLQEEKKTLQNNANYYQSQVNELLARYNELQAQQANNQGPTKVQQLEEQLRLATNTIKQKDQDILALRTKVENLQKEPQGKYNFKVMDPLPTGKQLQITSAKELDDYMTELVNMHKQRIQDLEKELRSATNANKQKDQDILALRNKLVNTPKIVIVSPRYPDLKMDDQETIQEEMDEMYEQFNNVLKKINRYTARFGFI